MITRLRSRPRTLLAISGMWVSLLLGASILWPAGYGFDEPAHVSMAYTYSARPFHWYAPGGLLYTKAVLHFEVQQAPAITPTAHLAELPIPGRSKRPTLGALGGATVAPLSGPDQMVQHPPAYYYIEAVLLRVPGVSGLSADLVIWLMRLVSVAMMAPIPFLCWDAARHLLPPTSVGANRLALLAAALPLTIPDLIRDGAAVNNDTLLILTTSFVLAMLTRVMRGDLSVRTAGFVAAGLAAALWTKGFALMLPLVVALAYVCGLRAADPGRPDRRGWIRPIVVVVAGALAGSVWWVKNLILYGTVQINGFGPKSVSAILGPPRGGGGLLPFIGPFFSGFLARIWGQIGIPADQPAPGPVVVYGWAVLAAIGILLALLVPSGRWDRARGWVLAVAVAALVAIDFDGSFATWRTYHLVRGNQGRYIYSAIVSVAALVTAGYARVSSRRVLRWAPTAVLIGAVLTNAWCWLLILRSDYQPSGHRPFLGGLADAVHALLRWAPTPDGLTVLLVLVLPVVASMGAVAISVRDARRPAADGRAPGPEGPVALASVAR